ARRGGARRPGRAGGGRGSLRRRRPRDLEAATTQDGERLPEAAAELLGGGEAARRASVGDREDRSGVVEAPLVVDLGVGRRLEAVSGQESLRAELVVLGERVEDVLLGQGGEGSHVRLPYAPCRWVPDRAPQVARMMKVSPPTTRSEAASVSTTSTTCRRPGSSPSATAKVTTPTRGAPSLSRRAASSGAPS